MRISDLQARCLRLAADRNTYPEWSVGCLWAKEALPPEFQAFLQDLEGHDDGGGRAVQAKPAAGGGSDGRRVTSAGYQNCTGSVLHADPFEGHGYWRPPDSGTEGEDGGAEGRAVNHGGGRGGERGQPGSTSSEADPNIMRVCVRCGSFAAYCGCDPAIKLSQGINFQDTGQDHCLRPFDECAKPLAPRAW